MASLKWTFPRMLNSGTRMWIYKWSEYEVRPQTSYPLRLHLCHCSIPLMVRRHYLSPWNVRKNQWSSAGSNLLNVIYVFSIPEFKGHVMDKNDSLQITLNCMITHPVTFILIIIYIEINTLKPEQNDHHAAVWSIFCWKKICIYCFLFPMNTLESIEQWVIVGFW